MSRDLVWRDATAVWHPYTQHGVDGPPLAVASARDAVLTLDDGRELVDGISSWWTCLHGHGRHELIEAMTAQAGRLDHVLFAGATHEPAVDLAEALLDVVPRGLRRVFFSDNGSTAVEIALKMAYQQWLNRGEAGRTVFVCLEGAYHGDTFGAMAVGDPSPFFEAFGPLLFQVERVAADAGRLEETLVRLEGRAAAVILEPLVQGAGGMRMHGPALLTVARELCDRHGLPLIADEVLTGFGRTGTLFACEQAGVTPDLLCLAKGLSGGMLPLAATLARESMFESFVSEDRARALFHGHSMTANPIACAVALASLQLCLEEEVPGRLDAVGARIEAGLDELAGAPDVHGLRRTGGIVALDLEPPAGETPGYFSSRSLELRRSALDRGVLLRPLGNVIYAIPPACTTDAQCDRIVEAIGGMIEDTRRKS